MKPSELGDRFIAASFSFASATATVLLALDCAPALSMPGAGFWLPVALACAFPVALSAAFGIKEGNTASMVRALAFALLALRGIQIATAAGPWDVRVIPKLRDILALVASGVCWVWSASIDSLLASRSAVLASVEGKTGAGLYAGLREEGLLISSTNGDLERVRDFCVLLPAILVAALAAIALTGHAVSLPSLLAVAAIFVLAGFIRAILQVYRSELYWAGLGLSEAFTLTRKRLPLALAMLVLCACAMLAVSGERPPLPATAFLALLSWLKAFFAPGANAAPIELPREQTDEPNGFGELLAELSKQQDASPNLAWFWTALGWLLLAAVAVGVVRFLFGPLIRREAFPFFRSGKTRARLRAFAENLRALARSFVGFFSDLRFGLSWARARSKTDRASVLAKASTSSFTESLRELIHPGLSKEKKKEIGKLTREFLRLVEWGAGHGVECGASTGPLEYAQSLAPLAGANVIGAGELFEKALYSRDLLDEAEETRFMRVIAETTEPEPSAQA